MKRALLDQLVADRAAKRAVVLVTNLDNGEARLVHPSDEASLAALPPALARAIASSVHEDRCSSIELPEGRMFLNAFNPPLRLLIVGAVHMAQPLARMAVLTGYDVVIVDPRRAFASEERFPGVTLLDDWPDDALRDLAPDHRTAVATLTHDPKIDDPALAMALRSPAFYIGALGSRKTHASRLARLAREGFDEVATARVHGPIGLDLGARSPAEIAVSILAQMTALLRRPAAQAGASAPASREAVAGPA